jgi:hypothetical protein
MLRCFYSYLHIVIFTMALSISFCRVASVKKLFHCISAMLLVSPVGAFLKATGSAGLGVSISFETLQPLNAPAA